LKLYVLIRPRKDGEGIIAKVLTAKTSTIVPTVVKGYVKPGDPTKWFPEIRELFRNKIRVSPHDHVLNVSILSSEAAIPPDTVIVY